MTVVIFVVAFFVRYDTPPSTAGYLLTVLGVIVLGVAGSLGWHLAYHDGVGVSDDKVQPERRISSGAGCATVHR